MRRLLVVIAVVCATLVSGGRSAEAVSYAPSSTAYWVVSSSGGAYGYGDVSYGDMLSHRLAQPVVGGATAPNGAGYWMVASDGGVFAFGSAVFRGSEGGKKLSAPMVGMAADPATGGYWTVGRDGGVFNFAAPFLGSAGVLALVAPVVGMAPTPDGTGYWLVASDGGVFSYGTAGFHGTAALLHLSAPIVGMAPTPDGQGYWLVGADGGVFAYGDAGFYGSAARLHLSTPITGITSTPDGKGYWMVGKDGGVFTFGDAPILGSAFKAMGTGRGVALLATARAHLIPPNSTGYDVSEWQCPAFRGGTLPTGAHSFAVVQVSGGAIDAYQPAGCYQQEAVWAGPDMMAYIFMSPLPSPGAAKSMSGPAGNCAASNLTCQYYNYGYNWAASWVSFAASEGTHPAMWWLDVETKAGWSQTTAAQALNATEIQGALDGLRADGEVPGIYATNYQWNLITGSRLNAPGIALWMAGATGLGQAAAFCSGNYSYDYQAFAGGRIIMAQWVTNYDQGGIL